MVSDCLSRSDQSLANKGYNLTIHIHRFKISEFKKIVLFLGAELLYDSVFPSHRPSVCPNLRGRTMHNIYTLYSISFSSPFLFLFSLPSLFPGVYPSPFFFFPFPQHSALYLFFFPLPLSLFLTLSLS